MQEMDEMCLVTHQNPAQVVLCAHSNDTIYTSFLWGLWSSPVDEACPTTFLRQILPFPKGKWFVIFCDKSFFFFFSACTQHSLLPPISPPWSERISFSPLVENSFSLFRAGSGTDWSIQRQLYFPQDIKCVANKDTWTAWNPMLHPHLSFWCDARELSGAPHSNLQLNCDDLTVLQVSLKLPPGCLISPHENNTGTWTNTMWYMESPSDRSRSFYFCLSKQCSRYEP